MTRPERSARYSTVAIGFHWLIAALVLFNLLVGVLHEGRPAIAALMPAHKAVGITVLALTALRIVWRLAHRPPAYPPSVSAGERRLALVTHWSLYALLVLMPFSGWLMASGPERPLSWFGLVPIPKLPVDTAARDAGHELHEVFGWVMVALVALHIAAALRHRFLLRDGVYQRMVPTGGRA